MAFIQAVTGGPPGPVQIVLPCGTLVPRAYLTIQVRNQHANGTPPLANTQVQVTVGGQQHTLNTDGAGLVTFVYDARADFAGQAIAVVLTDATRAWQGAGNTGAPPADIHQVAITVSGQFQLTVEIHTIKPGTGDIAWRHAWTANLDLTCATTAPGALAAANQNVAFQANANVPAEDEIQNHALDCVSAHVLTVGFFGYLPTSTVEVWTQGNQRVVGALDATHDDVTYRTSPNNGIRLEVSRRGAAVRVRFTFRFPQAMIVGEGTHFEYAVGLAAKYGNALANPAGFRWIVATQYDVTAVHAVSNDLDILNWTNGATLAHTDQRALVTAALEKNLVNHGAQFDATNHGHWAAALVTYTAFDAVIFNNPHPGYGMHMCEVLGLTTVANFARKNGRAISVYSFGYGVALDVAGRTPFLIAPNNTHLSVQRSFVRGNGAGELNHQNNPNTNVNFQYNPAHTTAQALDVQGAFQLDGGAAIAVLTYGQAGEMLDAATNHYRSTVITLGLQGWLLRSYRYHGPTVLKHGGWLYVHGSAAWNNDLTAAFSFHHAAANHAVNAMANLAAWRAGRPEYFVYYNTNFTSTRHHPSWYSAPNFNPGEPNINNSRAYGLQNP